jgi:dipeptidase E
MNLLLLSNSTNPGEDYLSWPQAYLKSFLEGIDNDILFIPYAGVTISWDDYFEAVEKALDPLGKEVTSIHHTTNPEKAVMKASAILVGGGNTFQLYLEIQENGLLMPIRKRVEEGVPYVGWSAGSNLACPGLYTSNDMPIMEPPSFDGLNLVSYQINPHYTDKVLEGHGGETRDQRLAEFLAANPDKHVIGLRESSLIEVHGGKHLLKGDNPAKVFSSEGTSEIAVGEAILI